MCATVCLQHLQLPATTVSSLAMPCLQDRGRLELLSREAEGLGRQAKGPWWNDHQIQHKSANLCHQNLGG